MNPEHPLFHQPCKGSFNEANRNWGKCKNWGEAKHYKQPKFEGGIAPPPIPPLQRPWVLFWIVILIKRFLIGTKISRYSRVGQESEKNRIGKNQIKCNFDYRLDKSVLGRLQRQRWVGNFPSYPCNTPLPRERLRPCAAAGGAGGQSPPEICRTTQVQFKRNCSTYQPKSYLFILSICSIFSLIWNK